MANSNLSPRPIGPFDEQDELAVDYSTSAGNRFLANRYVARVEGFAYVLSTNPKKLEIRG